MKKILHKGLLLLVFPLSIQCVLLLQFYGLYADSERLSKSEERYSSLISLSDRISSEFGKALDHIQQSLGEPDNHERFDVQSWKRRMLELSLRGQKLSHGDPLFESLFHQSDQLTEDISQILAALVQASSPDSTSSPLQKIKRLLEFRPRLKAVSRQFVLVQETKLLELTQLEAIRKKIATSRSQLRSQILISAVAEIALTALLIGFFLTDLTKRLPSRLSLTVGAFSKSSQIYFPTR